jgi:hypothetical protein
MNGASRGANQAALAMRTSCGLFHAEYRMRNPATRIRRTDPGGVYVPPPVLKRPWLPGSQRHGLRARRAGPLDRRSVTTGWEGYAHLAAASFRAGFEADRAADRMRGRAPSLDVAQLGADPAAR